MTTTENNRFIAEFMGGVLTYPTTCNYGVFKFSKEDKGKLTSDTEPTTENGIAQGLLKFHKSWDQLVPVLKRIKSLDVDLSTWRMITHPLDYDIEKVCNQAAEFIKQYKENN